MAQQFNIDIFAGDTYRSEVSVLAVDADGTETAIDITGFTFFFTAKRSLSDSMDVAEVHNTWTDHVNPTAGITAILLEPEETSIVGSYFYSFGYFTPDGDKKTLFEGKITFKKTADNSTAV